MAKFNTRNAATKAPAVPTSFISTATVPTGRTGEGAPGYERDSKPELYVLGVSNFVSEDTFYESGLTRDNRFKTLVQNVTGQDQDWVSRWIPWLRDTANMRSASLVAALEAAAMLVKLKRPGGRQIVAAALRRADEPGEALAYWFSAYGRKMPKPIKRGIADAARRLYTEYNWLKHDSSKDAFRFADVIELCHVTPADTKQSALFKHIVDSRHDHGNEIPSPLSMIRANDDLRALAVQTPQILTNSEALKVAGFTWEDAMSLLGSVAKDPLAAELKGKVWSANVQNMGYMALLRNLRNISEHVDARTKIYAASRISSFDEVERSRQFPFRFLSASKAITAAGYAHDWATALEHALQHSLQNVPELSGTTLILVDISGSMHGPIAGSKSNLLRVEAAGLFGAAMYLRNHGRATLVAFDDSSEEITAGRNSSVLALASKFQAEGGTNTSAAVQRHYRNHDRVIILTDEQAADGDPGRIVPAHIPLYSWNLGGYRYTSTAGKPLRYTFAGLNDSAFALIPLLEAGESQQWPF